MSSNEMENADALMRRRSALAEHPFGTLKCRAGYRHFLVRGFDKVRGEWSLMALCYNFTRVLNTIGFDGFTAYLARRMAEQARLLLQSLATAVHLTKALLAALDELFAPKSAIVRFRFTPAE